MTRPFLSFIAWGFIVLSAGTQAASVPTQEDERLVSVLERISRTTPEGSRIIDKVQEMKPEVSEIESTKKLMDMVLDYAFEKENAPDFWSSEQPGPKKRK